MKRPAAKSLLLLALAGVVSVAAACNCPAASVSAIDCRTLNVDSTRVPGKRIVVACLVTLSNGDTATRGDTIPDPRQ